MPLSPAPTKQNGYRNHQNRNQHDIHQFQLGAKAIDVSLLEGIEADERVVDLAVDVADRIEHAAIGARHLTFERLALVRELRHQSGDAAPSVRASIFRHAL